MASTLALRAVFGTSLSLGAANVAWLDLEIAPVLFDAPAAAAAPIVAAAPVVVDEPMPVATPVAPAPEVVPHVERIYFESMSATLDATARDAMAALAKRATDDLVVIGHSDHRGDEELNRSLRMRRALVVRDHLALLGISSDRVSVRAAEGASATPDAELWRDRRVEIHFTTIEPGGAR